jgi:hypothetical protein
VPARKPEPFLSLGFAAVDWIEHYLVHGPGDVQGQPVELDDEFAAFIVKAYQVDGKGERKVRRAFLSRPKGRSKSALAAMASCFEALGPCRFDHFAAEGEVSPWGYEYESGEPVGRLLTYVEILNVATEEGQAGNTYDAIYYMLDPETCSPELLRDFGKIDVGLTRTNLPRRRGFIEPVTSADSSKDGGKSTFIVADETHLWLLPRLKRLHGVMTRNLLKRKVASGWMLETSTMYGEGEHSVAEGTHDYAKAIALGRRRDRTLLFDHRQASDGWDLSKRAERMKALREAYGSASGWMNLDAICDSWDDPQVSEAEWRRYWLNQPVPMMVVTPSPVDLGRWAQAEDPASTAVSVSAFAVEITLDRLESCIGAAGPRPDGALHLEVVDSRPGTGWLVDRCVELNSRWWPSVFVVAKDAPAGLLADDLETAGLPVARANGEEVAAACAGLVDAVADGVVFHGPDPELDAALAGMKKKNRGDGAFTFGRTASGINLTRPYALTLAAWGHQHFGVPIEPYVGVV